MALVGEGRFSMWIWNNAWILLCGLLALGTAWGVQSNTIDSMKVMQVEIKQETQRQESRIRGVENFVTAQSEINREIRDALREIKEDLKELRKARPR